MAGLRCWIVLEGELSERFEQAFEGLALRCYPGYTELSGTLADQSQLQSLLNRLFDLGLLVCGLRTGHQCARLDRSKRFAMTPPQRRNPEATAGAGGGPGFAHERRRGSVAPAADRSTGPSPALEDTMAHFADYIVNRLFSIGLSLDSAHSIVGKGPAGDRVAAATDEVDRLIRQIRDHVFAERTQAGLPRKS